MDIDPNMTKEEARDELRKLNKFTWMREQSGGRFDIEEIIEIKTRQKELEKIYGGTDWL